MSRVIAVIVFFVVANVALVGFQRIADREDRAAFNALQRRLQSSERLLDAREASIASLDTQLAQLKASMDAFAVELDQFETALRSSRRARNSYAYYQKRVAEHNNVVDQYNTLRLDHEMQAAVYPGEIAKHNLLVDSTNAAAKKLSGTFYLIPIPGGTRTAAAAKR